MTLCLAAVGNESPDGGPRRSADMMGLGSGKGLMLETILQHRRSHAVQKQVDGISLSFSPPGTPGHQGPEL
eukprot:CAMPEP_0177625076 /NCGR_PEP_ID=MMETSP0419_2-20121207/29884_1 /TAXON_ID=582737 /ORGANISM="Tetraselmis sp., Strain GSL018" /LENGTH=70 /DNA_ID=CAMNT_0019125953 /DNA_START=74 /DNA_END=284 /DNA_ORIENTATION=-